MKHKTYILRSPLSAETTIERVAELLTKAGVQYRRESLSIVSTKTPLPLGSFDRTRYSNRNWVGLNPFVFVSSVNVRSRPGKSSTAEVIVQVNRFRALVAVGLWVYVGVLAAADTSKSSTTILFTVIGLAAWFGLTWLGFVSFLSGYLIKKEIRDCLEADQLGATVASK